MCYLCEKFYKPMTVQYYIADCLSSVSRLSLLDLHLTNKLGLPTLRTELVVSSVKYSTVSTVS